MNEIQNDLKAYLDKELSPERMEEVRLAIEQDPLLKEEAEFYQLLSRSIFSAAKTPEVSGMDTAVTKTLKATEKRKFSFPKLKSLPTWGIPAASAAAVCALAMIIFGPGLKINNKIKSQSVSTSAAVPATEKAEAAPSVNGAPSKEMPQDVESQSRSRNVPQQSAMPKRKAYSSAPSVEGVEKSRSQANTEAAKASVAPNQRLITRSGSLTVRVTNISESAGVVERIAQQNGGFVEYSNVSSDPKNPTADFIIRVSSAHWIRANTALKELGILINESASGSDVTAEVYDLEARVKTLQAEEDSLRTLLSRASRIGDILQIKDRLADVRMDIESMMGQAKNLRNLAAMSTISISLVQEPKTTTSNETDPWMGDAWTAAVNAFQSAFKTVIGFCAYVIVFAPFWLPALVISWLLVKKANKS